MYSSPLRVCTIAGTLPRKYVFPRTIKYIVDSDQASRKKTHYSFTVTQMQRSLHRRKPLPIVTAVLYDRLHGNAVVSSSETNRSYLDVILVLLVSLPLSLHRAKLTRHCKHRFCG